MNFLRPALTLVFLGLMPCISAMMPQLPPYTEKDIVKLIITDKDTPEWITWLIKLNQEHLLTISKWCNLTDSVISLDWSCIYLTYRDTSVLTNWLAIKHQQIDLPDSFQQYSMAHPHKLKRISDTSMIATRFDEPLFTIHDARFKHYVGTAFSPDGKRFVAITSDTIFIMDGSDGTPIDTIKLNHKHLQRIVAIKEPNYEIVIQDSYTIFSYDPTEKTIHTIYVIAYPFENITTLALKDRYMILRQCYPSCLVMFSIIDMYDLLPSLHLDQIILLKVIHQAARKRQKFDITRAGHVQEVFKSLPERIYELVKEYVIMPERTNHCIIS